MPYLSDPDITLYCGDALEVLRELPGRSLRLEPGNLETLCRSCHYEKHRKGVRQ